MNVAKISSESLSYRLPATGYRLLPGCVLVELAVATADLPKRVLFDGLRAMGFTAVSLARMEREDDLAPSVSVRFLGTLGRAIDPENTDLITWVEASPIGFDVFSPVPALDRLPVEPFVLEPNTEYEMRFVARVKAFPRASTVVDALDGMSFDVHELIAIRRDGILSNIDEPDAYSAWYGRARWLGPMSVVTPEDPFYFCNLKKLVDGRR